MEILLIGILIYAAINSVCVLAILIELRRQRVTRESLIEFRSKILEIGKKIEQTNELEWRDLRELFKVAEHILEG